MSWRQVLVALICTSLTVRSSPCSWMEVLSSWSQGYKAVVKLQMEETVDHWDVDLEFSESVINFEAWKGHVNKISDTHYTVSNTCYNNMVYSCQCFELPYLVRHEPIWEGNTTFKFNGELVPACEPPSCDDSLSGVANTTSTTQPAESLTTSELTENLNVVGNILNDLSSLGLKRYKRQANGFTEDENELLDTLAEYTTYLKNECSTKSGSCQSKTLAAYGSKLNSIFQKVKNSGGISSGFVDAFKEKYEQLKEATKTAVDNQSENSCKANGKPCIFPFKDDAGKEHNTCADYKGKYFWCATRVNSKGKYISWERCPDDGRCPLPKTTTTTTTTTTTPPPPTKQPHQGVACMAGSKPCVFPFKDTDGTEYNECADYKGRYFWCATAVNSKGTFTNWGKCTECEDPNTTPSTPEDCSCTDYINKKGYRDCQKGHPDFSNAEICYVKLPSTCSDLRESKTDPGKMASAEACKKVDGDDSCCQELDIASTGVALEHQGARLGSYKKQKDENDGKPVYLQEGSGGNYLFYRETFGWLISRQGPQSTSKGGIMSDSEADCPTDGGMQWKIYDRVTYDNIDSTFKLTCSDTTVSHHPTKPQGSCLANGKPCIFPFKDDDGTSYNGCPKYEGRYYWCATSLKTNGVYEVWEHCPEDGSCPLLDNDDSSTPAALPKLTTKPSESPETTPSVKWEPGTTSFYIRDGNNNYKCEITFEFNSNKKTEFKAISSKCSESAKQEDVLQYVGKHNFNLISKEGATLECFVGAAIARGDLCQTVLEDSLHCDSKSESTCDKTRAGGHDKRWDLQECPHGYQTSVGAAPLYTLMDWTKAGGEYTIENCTDACKGECRALIYTHPCEQCKLLTDKEYAKDKTKPENKYCLKSPGGCEWLSSYQGYQPSNSDKRLIGGMKAVDSTFVITPWMASIRILRDLSDPSALLLCGGVLISCQHILTALHCLTDDKIQNVYPKSAFEIFLGSTKRWDIDKDSLKFYAEDIFYKKYGQYILTLPLSKPPRPVHDIALIKLDRPINEELAKRRNIYPIMLPQIPLENVYDKDFFWFAGWGQTLKNGQLVDWSDDLIQSNDLVMILDQQNIDTLLTKKENTEIKDHYIRGRDIFFQLTKEHSTCEGDSGSPGMQLIGDRWFLYTIASWNLGNLDGFELGGCGSGVSLHINVFSYLGDIDEWMKK